MKDSREMRKAFAIFVSAGVAAVLANKLIEPKVRKAVKAR